MIKKSKNIYLIPKKGNEFSHNVSFPILLYYSCLFPFVVLTEVMAWINSKVEEFSEKIKLGY